MEQQSHCLLVSGMLLFILGLLNGVAIPFFKNARMGLSAHLAGVQNAIVLLVFGIIWSRLSLSELQMVIGYWFSLYSMYAIWFALVLAGIWGTSRSTPIAGSGFRGSPVQEATVRFFLLSGSLAILVASGLLLFGLLSSASAR